METGGEYFVPQLTGHSTRDALRILHDELQNVILAHEANQRQKSLYKKCRYSFLNHNNRHSPLHWTNCLVLLVLAAFLVIAYGAQETRDHWLIAEAFLLLFGLALNVYAIEIDEKLKENEIVNKTKFVLKSVKACSETAEWGPEHFVNLHAPFAPSVSLQWTYRDGAVVNLPCAFLVEGDIILLRPGQEVPAKCRTLEYFPQLLGDNEIEELNAGDLFNPRGRETSTDNFTLPETREPLKSRPFIMLETPYTQNLKMMISPAYCRPVSVINNERYMVYSVWVERRILPAVLIFSFLTNLLRYVFLQDKVGHWTDMFIVLQVQALIPLSALVLPLLWKVLDIYGTAKIMIVFDKFRTSSVDVEVQYKGEFGSESSTHVPTDVTWTWKEICGEMFQVMLGKTSALPRTCNIAHVLGNVTSFCCVDKKGVLSWPNPTAEKVFFLRNDIGSKEKEWSSTSGISEDDYSGADHIDSFDEEFKSVSNKNIKEQDYLLETNFEVLDLTQDANNGYKLHFDDPSWKKYLSSLKPLGLNILLNTCNLQTVNKYTEFADHVTCASLKREEAAPVLNRRCFCELARQIGFSECALEIFKLHQILGMYRHLPPQSSGKNVTVSAGNKSFIRYKMPMPNMFSVVAKEINTGMSQLMSQGTADVLLDACSDYWDGHDLCALNEIDRKKITDFYQRTSMSSYCTAFSYRPLTQALGSEFKDLYIEIPEVHDQLYPQVHSPTPTKSWDTESLDSRLQSSKSKYHCSMDSLLINMESNSIHDIDGAFRMQCNQVFIGMITMQYQAKQDVVELIEDLESACIRFVHFSKENELRSRVFSEKMGLEAGWNCHISLLGGRGAEQEDPTTANTAVTDGPQPPSKITVNVPSFASSGSLQRIKAKRSNDSLRYRRGSAPSAINLEITQVKFESGSPLTGSPAQSPNTANCSRRLLGHSASNQELENSSHVTNRDRRRRDSDEHSDKLTAPLLKDSPDTDMVPAPSATEREDESEMELQLLESKSGQCGQTTEADENLSSSESYPASSSHFTENTDSVTGGFGLTNRAKLPKGIENIRPHIDNVDNVPLLVSLFTDCTPDTSREMISILQDYGEVVCCLGSSANIQNTGIYMQADCSLSVEPMYPHVCMCEPAVCNHWFESTLGPLELSTMLHSLPCALDFRRKDKISIMQLIAQARQHVQGIRHTFLLLLMLQLSLVVMQLVASTLLPPLLAPHHVLWLAALALPLLALTINANPLDTDIMKKALGKNIHHLSNQVVLEFLFYFCAGCIPTICVCLLCHAVNLYYFCLKLTFDQTNGTCHLLYGHSEFPESRQWNGWVTEYSSGLAMSQNIVAFQFLLYSGCATLCFIHRYHHLWQRSPFNNRILCFILPILILLQLIYCIADIGIRNELGSHQFQIEDIPVVTWVLALVWPFILIAIQELIKRREIKLYVRYQKRARLDFGTKLGMNSPF